MGNRIRLYGARLYRFIARLAIFIGMMGLYSLFLGSSDWHLLYGGLLVAALTVGLVFLWVTSRSQRKLDRSHQLAAEVRTLYPDFPAEEQNRAYTRRRRREMRVEALWYLLFAVLSALWFWALYATDAPPLIWVLGVRTILPALALISAGLLVGSFLPGVAKERMPEISREETRAALSDDPAPDRPKGDESSIGLSQSKTNMTPEEYIRKERKELRRTILLHFIAFAFFALLPLTMFVLMWCYGADELTLFGFITFFGVAFWIILCLISHTGPAVFILMFIQLYRLRTGKYRAYRDTIVSHDYREKDGILELRLARTGTVKVRCLPEVYAHCFAEPKNAAMMRTTGGHIEQIVLMPGSEPMPAAAGAAEAAARLWEERDDGLLLDEEYCRQAALRKIEGMTVEQRRAMEMEIESRFDGVDRMREKGYYNLTMAEKSKIDVALAEDIRRQNPDMALHGIETALMEKLGVTRADILRITKNPFVPSLRKRLILAAAVGLCGNLGTALEERLTGADLGFVYLVFSACSGFLALSCGEALVNALRFRKLQKAYRDPQYRRKLLDAAVYQELKSQVERRRAEEKPQ